MLTPDGVMLPEHLALEVVKILEAAVASGCTLDTDTREFLDDCRAVGHKWQARVTGV